MLTRNELLAATHRANAISNRVSNEICRRIQARQGLDKLDELMSLADRSHKLFWRIYARFEQQLPEGRSHYAA